MRGATGVNDWTTDSLPDLLRIGSVTTGAPDLAAAEAAYAGLLKLSVVERGHIDEASARSWATPSAVGAAYTLLVPQNETDVFFRLIETPAVPGYRPLTTFGWNAFEIIVDDVESLADAVPGSGFHIIGPPRPLNFMPSIIAMQVTGPANECLYFTMESGDRETSILPPPKGPVGRTFIVVAGGADFTTMLRWYVDNFNLRERPVRESKVAVLQAAQGLDQDHTIALSAIGMRERGNLVELDGYPNGPGHVSVTRPRAKGHLPPGNAMVSLIVEDIERWLPLSATGEARLSSRMYGGCRSCMIVGPAEELIELVEAV
ncbi:hypothetical protein ACSMXM_13425 [Pacificimonas sp. ICDLI1SI03]